MPFLRHTLVDAWQSVHNPIYVQWPHMLNVLELHGVLPQLHSSVRKHTCLDTKNDSPDAIVASRHAYKKRVSTIASRRRSRLACHMARSSKDPLNESPEPAESHGLGRKQFLKALSGESVCANLPFAPPMFMQQESSLLSCYTGSLLAPFLSLRWQGSANATTQLSRFPEPGPGQVVTHTRSNQIIIMCT